MANPKRETKRERRDEAKRRRLEELRRRQRRERMRRFSYLGVAAAVVAGIILFVTLLGGDGANTAELNRLATAAGCQPIRKQSNEGSTHVNPPQTVTYRSNPPTSGNHYGSTAQTGIHPTPVQNEFLVHNLEHGHVEIQYKDGLDPAILAALYTEVKADPQWLLLVPSTTIPSPLTFSAWEHSQLCDSPTTAAAVVAALEGFVDAHKDNAPESVKGTALPGTDTATPPTTSGTGSPTASPSPSPTPTAT